MHYSNTFQIQNPKAWQTYEQAYSEVKETYDLQVDQEMLFKDVADPDSVLTQAPVQVFLKNKYIWWK